MNRKYVLPKIAAFFVYCAKIDHSMNSHFLIYQVLRPAAFIVIVYIILKITGVIGRQRKNKGDQNLN